MCLIYNVELKTSVYTIISLTSVWTCWFINIKFRISVLFKTLLTFHSFVFYHRTIWDFINLSDAKWIIKIMDTKRYSVVLDLINFALCWSIHLRSYCLYLKNNNLRTTKQFSINLLKLANTFQFSDNNKANFTWRHTYVSVWRSNLEIRILTADH
jgi:hypothetical protein